MVAVAALAAATVVDVVGARAAERTAAVPTTHYLLFSGFDLWRGGGSLHGGLMWSPQGLEHDGFVLKLLLGGGEYRYRSGAIGGSRVRGTMLLGAVMPGWRFHDERLEVTIYGGLDLQHHRLRPNDPANRIRGGHAGVRVGADLWWEPTPSMMSAVSVSLSSIEASYWTRGAFGWRLFDLCYVGPELLALGGGSYWQLRIGAHMTAFKTGALEWSAGAGLVEDADDRTGLYGRLSVLMRR